MKSAIKEIYNVSEYYEKIKPSEEYYKVHARYDEIFEKLLKNATKEQMKLLDDLFVQGGGLESEFAETHFVEGFKLGFRLAAECFI